MSEFFSIVVSAYNKLPVLGEFHQRLSEVMSTTDMDYEIVDGGSTDDTTAPLKMSSYLGIIGEYLARTYNESKSRALYFVKGYLLSRKRASAGAETRINI